MSGSGHKQGNDNTPRIEYMPGSSEQKANQPNHMAANTANKKHNFSLNLRERMDKKSFQVEGGDVVESLKDRT